ncbi:MAG TPA: rhodanese-like domain-containing protein [Bacteroidales bacterium]
MNKKYIFLALLLTVLAGGLLLLPEKENLKQIPPEELMIDIMQPTRYVSTDQVAQMIIEGDPTLLLVDVRANDEFAAFSLPGALNIPLDSLLTESSNDYLKIEGMNTVFFDNDDIKADQTWVVSKRLGYNNIYVLKGGLNHWISTIIQPEPPVETASSEEFDLYDFRKGASIYFTGAKIETSDVKAEINVVRKKKGNVAEGGC